MTASPVTSFGSNLRVARERSGRSLRQIADVTKLSVRTLEALEQNRIGQLPGGIYRRSIVRSYASQIGLDPERTLGAFLAEYPDEMMMAEVPVPSAPPVTPARRVLQAVASLLGTLLLLIASVFSFSRTALR